MSSISNRCEWTLTFDPNALLFPPFGSSGASASFNIDSQRLRNDETGDGASDSMLLSTSTDYFLL